MTDALGNRLDDCGVCTLLPTVTGTVRAEQATCPVHGTWPYAPLSAPSASSQALPADQDAHPVVRAGAEALGSTVDEYDIRRADDSPEEWCAECLPRDAAAINAARLVAPAVLRAFADRMREKAGQAPEGLVGWPWTGYATAAVRADAEADEITRSDR